MPNKRTSERPGGSHVANERLRDTNEHLTLAAVQAQERAAAAQCYRDQNEVLVKKQEQLRLLVSELGRIEERERKRVATDLHDNLAQMLAFCRMKVETLQQDLMSAGSRKVLNELKGVLNDALTYTRTLMSDLQPSLMGDAEDVPTAVSWVVGKIRRHGLVATIRDDGEPKWLSDETLTVTYQAVRELLWNVLKHAKTKQAEVCLQRSGEYLEAIVIDQGIGFDAAAARTLSDEGGFGLFNIRERVEALGGRLEITSVPHGGTSAKMIVPLQTPRWIVPELHPRDTDTPTVLDGPAAVAGSKIRVLLVDDHRMMREGLRSTLDGQPDMAVVAEASNGRMAVEKVRAHIRMWSSWT